MGDYQKRYSGIEETNTRIVGRILKPALNIYSMVSKNKIIILALITVFLVTSGLGCKGTTKEVQKAIEPVELNVWRVFDDTDTFQDIIKNYKQLRPHVTVRYRKLKYEEYEQALLEAWAEDRGPDVFSIHNTWVGKYQNKISPMPASLTLPYTYTSGTIKKETKTVLRQERTISLRDLSKKFTDQVFKDAARDGKVLGLPLAVDTLVLYSNRDLLNQAGLTAPPATWEGFKEAVVKLTSQDQEGNIRQAGAAFGRADNVERAFDILSLLMLQNGTEMVDSERGGATFDRPSRDDRSYLPGLKALEFYTDFANPAREVYTWNETLPQSLEAFIQGKAAFFFGYSYHLPLIQVRAPKLNFEISPAPQIEGNPPVNYASYWLESVSFKSKNKDIGWDFVLFASQKEQAESYLAFAKKPAALRELIDKQKEDIDLGPFAEQILTAKSWYQGKDANAAERIFLEMISQANEGAASLNDIIRLGAQKVNQTL